MIAVVGSSGYIGNRFVRYFQHHGIAYYGMSRWGRKEYSRQDMNRLLESIRATHVINAAGYVGVPNVDACEDHKTECLSANVWLPAMLSDICKSLGIVFCNVSSGCIYQGDNNGRGYSEEDTPNFDFRHNNCSFYSGCKAMAEEILSQSACYQWRLRMPFDSTPHPRNIITKILSYDHLVDYRNSFSNLDEFVNNCYLCLSNNLPFGAYNLTNTGSMLMHEIVDALRDYFPSKSFSFISDLQLRESIRSPRSSCVLDNTKATLAGLKFRNINDAMKDTISQYVLTASAAVQCV